MICFGKYQIDETLNGSSFMFEFCGKDEDFWLPVTTVNGFQLGHMFFKKIAQGVFEI